MSERLYVVVRADLPIGLQMAQACHAAYRFAVVHGSVDIGETMVVLHAPDEKDLVELGMLVHGRGDIPLTAFVEPDLNNEVTAVAFSGAAKPFLRHLPLAFKSSPDSSGARAHTAGTCTPTGDAPS